MSDILKKAKQNLVSNIGKKENYNIIAWAMLGAILEPIIPSAIQGLGGADEKGLPKWNMSGWKTVTSGVLGGTLIGFLVNRPGIAYGSIAAGAAHIFWVKAQDSIMELTKFPIPPFDPNAVIYGPDLKDGLPEGFKAVTLPNGKTIIAEVGPAQAQPTQQLSEYIDTPKQLADYMDVPKPGMSDYMQVPGSELSEFNYPEEKGNTTIGEYINLNDDYENLVDSGAVIS